mmetsp:Transcript_17137/g.25966  ORF Transcript_17137/g.25966 Transcript_17137/m.25966 type:complete len:199 (+) Transcript_17137:152-748(+)
MQSNPIERNTYPISEITNAGCKRKLVDYTKQGKTLSMDDQTNLLAYIELQQSMAEDSVSTRIRPKREDCTNKCTAVHEAQLKEQKHHKMKRKLSIEVSTTSGFVAMTKLCKNTDANLICYNDESEDTEETVQFLLKIPARKHRITRRNSNSRRDFLSRKASKSCPPTKKKNHSIRNLLKRKIIFDSEYIFWEHNSEPY